MSKWSKDLGMDKHRMKFWGPLGFMNMEIKQCEID
jgi:hypothetical protein